MKKFKTRFVLILLLLILIFSYVQLEKQVSENSRGVTVEEEDMIPRRSFTPPKDLFPSEVEGVIEYIDLSKIGPISPDECSKYIKNEPDRTICYFVLAIRNKDKELCAFVRNYTIIERGCTCLGAGHGGCCEREFNWTLNKNRCISIVEGETFHCPFTLGYRCKYDKFKESYHLNDKEIKLSREFGILCRNEDCVLSIAESIAKNHSADINKAKEICDSLSTYYKSLCYKEIAPIIATSDFEFAVDLCRNIPNESRYYDKRIIDCYSNVAAAIASIDLNKSLELCEYVYNYPGNNFPYTCYRRVAWALPKVEGIKICDQYIPPGKNRDQCLFYVSRKK